jgi:hypothetical protein
LDFVATGEHGLVDRFAVDVRTVKAADVYDDELPTLPPELGVPAGNSDVVEKDVAVRMPTGTSGVDVEKKSGARIRPALDDQQGLAGSEGIHPGGLRLGGSRSVLAFDVGQEVGPEDGRPLRGLLRGNARPVVRAHLSSPNALMLWLLKNV